MSMVTFIATKIMEFADRSIEQGQSKYKAYFINTKLYTRYKADVDTILRTDGYEQVIVE